jgi:hypothetical protein
MRLSVPRTGKFTGLETRSAWFWIRLAAGLCAIVVVVLVLLVVVAQALHVAVMGAADLSTLLAVLGGMMGTIFVIGGLVVALAAVVQVLSVREQVQAVLDEQEHALDKRFNDLRAQVRDEAEQQIQGYIALQQARDARDWRSTVTLAREALQAFPALRGVRSFVALKLTTFVVNYFVWEHSRTGTGLALAETLATVGLGEVRDQPPTSEALAWLMLAQEQGDDPGGQITAALPLIYGVEGRYDEMLDAVRTCFAHASSLGATLQESRHLIALAHACGTEPTRLRALGDQLGRELPVPAPTIFSALRPLTTDSHSDWWVIPRAPGRGASWSPGVVRFFIGVTPTGQQGVRARCISAGPDEPDFPPELGVYADADAVVQDIGKQYLFICPAEQIV